LLLNGTVDIAGDLELDPAVGGSPLVGLIGLNRLGLSVSDSLEARLLHALSDQVLHHRFRSLLRQGHVGCVSAARVSVPLYFVLGYLRMSVQDLCNVVEKREGLFQDPVPVRAKEDLVENLEIGVGELYERPLLTALELWRTCLIWTVVKLVD